MMAPEPPSDFVPRLKEFDLKQKLLDANGDAVAVTAALCGAGGYGKTTLAKAFAHDEGVQDAYFDGILWVDLGEKPDNLRSCPTWSRSSPGTVRASKTSVQPPRSSVRRTPTVRAAGYLFGDFFPVGFRDHCFARSATSSASHLLLTTLGSKSSAIHSLIST